MVCQAVDEGIRGAVISLGRIAKNARDGGEHNETIEIHFARRFVEQPCPLRFRFEDLSHALRCERGQWRIIDHHREMKNTAERMGTGIDLREQPPDVVRRADVGRHDAHLRRRASPSPRQIFQPPDSKRRCGSSARDGARRSQPTI